MFNHNYLRFSTIRLTSFGKASIIIFLISIFIGIPMYRYVMSPLRVMKKAFRTLDADALQWAIDKGVNVNTLIKDSYPIALAFHKGQHGFMQRLAKAGANLDVFDDRNVSLAGLAAQINDSTALSILGKHGASFHARADTIGHNVLTHMLSNKKHHLLAVAMHYTDCNVQDHNGGRTPLHYADNIDAETIARLVDRGENPNAPDSTGNTPLHIVSQVTAVQALHESGADINSINNCGVPALFYQVGTGNARIYQYMINNGAEIDEADEYGNTVLTYAMMTSNELLHRQVSDNYCQYYPQKCEQAKKNLKSTGFKALATLVYTRTAHRAIMNRLAASQAAKTAIKKGALRAGVKRLGFRLIPIIGWASTIHDGIKVAEAIAEYDKSIRAHRKEADRLAAERREAQAALREQFLDCNQTSTILAVQ